MEILLKNQKRKTTTPVWRYLIFVLMILMYILPMYVLINMSLREVTDISSRLYPPKVIKWDNYSAVFNKSFLNSLKNSVFIMVWTVVIEILFGSMAAYGLVRSQSKIADRFASINMGIMMIPGLALLVGTYSLMVRMKLVNSLWGIILLSVSGGLPATSFMFANYIKSIPTALDEAATIDGASVFRTYISIIMPQLKAITITRMIMTAVGSWNNYLMPVFLLQKKSKYTIILLIKTAFDSSGNVGNLPQAAATCVLGILPIIILYIFAQRYIIEGQIDSAVK
jgi:raffinose/stachyose/melibiose transport system permease protein